MPKKRKKPVMHFETTSMKTGPALWNHLANRYEELLESQYDEVLETWEQLNA